MLPEDDFYNDLGKETISNEEYQHHLKVRDKLQLKEFQEYLELYLKTDVLQLADVCNAYRSLCVKNYGLDPFHFISAPSMTWRAALKMTRVELELLTDADMFNFVQRGIRGGVSSIATKQPPNNWIQRKYFMILVEIVYSQC